MLTSKIFSSGLFYFMLAHFALLVILVALNGRRLWEEVRKIDKKIWALLLLIFLYGFWLRNAEYWLGPHTDGYVAQEAAHLWVTQGEFVKACALGNHADCQVFEKVLAPPGFPFLIALAHLIFGIHSLNASVISAVLSSLTIILAFLIAYLIFRREEAGLYAALAFSLVPLNIINSQSGEARPTGLFFAGLAWLLFILAIRSGRPVTWLAWLVSLSYAIYVRQESYVLVPFFIIFAVILKWSRIKAWAVALFEKKADLKIMAWGIFFIGLFLICQAPVLQWLLHDNPYSSYRGGAAGLFALSYKTILTPAGALALQLFNLSPVAGQIWHYNLPVSLVFLASALIFIFWRREKGYWLPWGFFGAYFLIYCLLFEGNIYGDGRLTGDYFRRTLMFHLPVAVAAGYGFYFLNPLKERRFLIWNLLLVFLLSLAINPIFYFAASNKVKTSLLLSSSRLVSGERLAALYFPSSLFKDSRATKTGDRSLIYPSLAYWSAIGHVPNGCSVISSQYMIVTNDYFQDNRRRAVSVDLINDETKNRFQQEFKKSGCLVLLDDYRCRQESIKNDPGCRFIADSLVKEELIFKIGEIEAYRMKIK